MSTFIEDATKPDQKLAVGYYVPLSVYKRYLATAQELYKQTDETGKPVIDNPSVNDFVLFAVNFFEQQYSIYKQYANNKGGAATLIKTLLKQLS